MGPRAWSLRRTRAANAAAAGSGALLTRADRVAWRAWLHCCDYKEARRIINGLDQWQLIKGYADTLELILRAAIGP